MSGLAVAYSDRIRRPVPEGLYTAEQRRLRDRSPWTRVQGALAPLQFVVFLISLGLLLRFLVSGQGLFWAELSILVKTTVLYAIMVTGALWERDVFGRLLFAPAFFWEDVVSMLVIALHTAYLVMLFGGLGSTEQQLLVALAAYAAYVVNAAQFLRKFRLARRPRSGSAALAASSLAEQGSAAEQVS